MLGDLIFTLRSLRRQLAFTLGAVATLAVGIGATTAIFSTVNAVLLRPLPFHHPEDIYALYAPATDGRFTTGRDSGVEIMGLNNPALSVVRAAGSARNDGTLIQADGTPVPIVGAGVTEGFFGLFGMPLMMGADFTPAHHLPGNGGGPQQLNVIVSHRMWRTLLGSDPAIVGKTIRLTNGGATVLGVAAEAFDIPRGADLWIPFAVTKQSTGHGFDGYLRVKPGANRERLREEMAGVMAGLAREFGPTNTNRAYQIRPLADAMVGDLGTILLVVLAGAGLLLVLACVNVTNLMLARGAVRAREIAVRVALGAGRARIVRQFLTESLVLATLGTLLGLALAFAAVRVLLVMGASQLPRLESVPFDMRVLGFALAALVFTAFVVGFAPALRLTGNSLRSLINESGRSAASGGAAHRTLKTMIVAEIAVAIVLVAGAGWLVRSFSNLGAADAGFRTDNRLVMDILVPGSRYGTPEKLMGFSNQLHERLAAIPGVAAVGTASTFPFGQDYDAVLYLGVQGQTVDPDHPLVARQHRVSPDFFEAMGVKVLAGRAFTADDRQGSPPVTIVNRAFARRYLPGNDPLRNQFAAGYPNVPTAPFYTIVGVVDDMKYVSMSQDADPAFYVPEAQSFYFRQSIVAKTNGPAPAALATNLRAALKDVDPLVGADVRTLSDIVSASLRKQRLGMTLMLVFAGAALVLAAVGIYGVIAYASAQREGEVATRMALGATPSEVFWLMMSQGRTLAIVGAVAGLGLAYAAGRVVSSRLYEIRASDPAILLTAATLVLAITFLAIAFPARRAARVDPSRILRND